MSGNLSLAALKQPKVRTTMPDDKEMTEGGRCEAAAPFIRGALLLQEKWVLMIVFRLQAGPLGFSELMRRGSVNTTTLTQRLNLLEQTGLLVKTIHSTMPPRTSYELTEAGLALRPTLDAISDWSGTYLSDLRGSSACPGLPSQEQLLARVVDQTDSSAP